jgi:hypothetical protein
MGTQAPLPLHVAVQEAAGPHSCRRSIPYGCGTHVPGCDGKAHVLHAPSHFVSQQTPSTQNPLGQSAANLQVR